MPNNFSNFNLIYFFIPLFIFGLYYLFFGLKYIKISLGFRITLLTIGFFVLISLPAYSLIFTIICGLIGLLVGIYLTLNYFQRFVYISQVIIALFIFSLLLPLFFFMSYYMAGINNIVLFVFILIIISLILESISLFLYQDLYPYIHVFIGGVINFSLTFTVIIYRYFPLHISFIIGLVISIILMALAIKFQGKGYKDRDFFQ